MSSDSVKHFVFLRQMHSSAKGWGGLEKLMFDWFTRIDYKHCRVTLVVSSGFKEFMQENMREQGVMVPINVVEFPFHIGEGNFLIQFLRMYFFLLRLKPNCVIFLQGWFHDFTASHVAAASSLTWGNVYMHENSGGAEPPPRTSKVYFGFIKGFGVWWYLLKFKKIMRVHFSKAIFVVGKEVSEKAVSLWGYPASKIKLQYHGVNTSRFFPSGEVRKEMRGRLGIDEKARVIIVTARLVNLKRIDRTINAFDMLSLQHPDLYLLIVGTGPEEVELKKLAESKRSKERIRFLGHMQDVSSYLKMSDIFVLSSDVEGFSLAILEAMASGLICISTDCSGACELIDNGVNGYIVDKSTEGVFRGLKSVLDLDEKRKKDIVEAGMNFVASRFDINERIKDIFNVIRMPYAGGPVPHG